MRSMKPTARAVSEALPGEPQRANRETNAANGY